MEGWNLSHEREFMENLFVGRFNYFLVVFSVVITAGFANNFHKYKSVVFYIGALVLFLVWLLLYRAYKKHDLLIRIIYEYKKDHPASKINEFMILEDGSKPKYKAALLMGVTIPWICISLLFGTGIAVALDLLK